MNKMSKIVYNNNQDNNKYKHWVFTWNSGLHAGLPEESKLYEILSFTTEDFAFQKERGEITGRDHYQGLFSLSTRQRKRTILRAIEAHLKTVGPGSVENLTLSPRQGTKDQALEYVTKSDTRVGLTYYSPKMRPYIAKDLALFQDKENWHYWQLSLHEILFEKSGLIKEPDHRTIIWITDVDGGTGKSKYVKYLVTKFTDQIMKVPFGTASQLRSSLCMAGARSIYFVDIPRSLGQDDDMASLYSTLEDLKNGFIVTSMYGAYKTLICEPPHIVVFSNWNPKDLKKLSLDRWRIYHINEKSETLPGFSLFSGPHPKGYPPKLPTETNT